MTYPEVIQYLESLINYEKIPAYSYKESLKLERVKDFLDIIGNPQESLRCIHIAGTKGKGSTCAFIVYILRQAGYKVGLYTSPHLSDFRERIRILQPNTEHLTPNSEFEGMISKQALTDLISRLKPFIEKYNKSSKYGPLSFFEVYTCLAFVYFKKQKADFAVLETGLGGRLDATNVVNPYVCAITSLSYEHTQKLGNTLRKIATEKAGIIKNQKSPPQRFAPKILAHPPILMAEAGPPRILAEKFKIKKLIVISAPQEKEAREVIRNKCKEVGAELFEVGKDILYEKINGGCKVKGLFGEYSNLKIRLIGTHQLINATVAIGVIEALRLYNIDVDANSIRNGLYSTVWPGRCEVISQNPLVVLDGAQNVASSHALKEAIKMSFKYKRLILVLGISSDKDIKGICNELTDLADKIILTRANNPRAILPAALANYFNGKEVHITGCVREAKVKAKDMTGKRDLILVTGSLFVVGEFRDDKI